MITPRKGLFAVALLLLLCGLLRTDWTIYVSRPINHTVKTLQWPAGMVASWSLITPDPESETAHDDDPEESLVHQLEAANQFNRHLYNVNRELRDQLATFQAITNIKDMSSFQLVDARVSSRSNDPANPTIDILQGSLRGLQRNDPVLYRSDLIGFVTDQIGPTTATVQLINHPDFSMQVHIQPPINQIVDIPEVLERDENDDSVNAGELIDQRLSESGWPLVDRIETDDDTGELYLDMRISLVDGHLQVGDFVTAGDSLYESATGIVIGVIDRVERHPNNPELLRRVFIRPRTPIGEQGRVIVITEVDD